MEKPRKKCISSDFYAFKGCLDAKNLSICYPELVSGSIIY